MKLRTWWRWRFAFLLLAAASTARAQEPKQPKRLHVVIVTADDMNADSSGWMGNALKPTPNLDKFAARSQRFIHCHVTAPICQPSRSAFMTGRVPHRNGALGFNPIRTDVPTLVQLLAAHGYYTAVVNKFEHMTPTSQFPWDTKLGGSGRNPEMMRAQVQECLRAASDAKKPIFLNVNTSDPHRPFPGGEAAAKKKKPLDGAPVEAYAPADVKTPSFLEDLPEVRKEIAQYYTSVRRFDQSFGEILAVLEEAGILDNAIVVFLSDHGMSFPFSKATLYRNGTWSPVLMRWPGMGEPIENRTDMLSSVDVLPTILDVLGVPAPDGLDGRSWLPLVKGEHQRDRDHVITHVNTVNSGAAFPGRCVRTLNHSYIWYAWPDGKIKLRAEAMNGLTFRAMAERGKVNGKVGERVAQYHLGVMHGFYDLRNDPDERRNLIDDSQHQQQIARLRQILVRHMERTKDPQLDVFQRSLKVTAENNPRR
jgi:N-sulfoglucosamine sulfohydrolase